MKKERLVNGKMILDVETEGKTSVFFCFVSQTKTSKVFKCESEIIRL